MIVNQRKPAQPAGLSVHIGRRFVGSMALGSLAWFALSVVLVGIPGMSIAGSVAGSLGFLLLTLALGGVAYRFLLSGTIR